MDVTVYTTDAEDPIEFPVIERVSFVNAQTHGALPAVDRGVEDGQSVLFVNPGAILAMEVVK